MLFDSFLGCALFIPRGCRIHRDLALMVPRVGLKWPPGMNWSLYLKFGKATTLVLRCLE